MTTAAAVTVLAMVAAPVPAQDARAREPASRPAAGGPAGGDLLAAESFRHAAVEMICSASETPARAGRLVVLCRFADRLAPGEPHAARLLADIHFAQGRPEDEARALAHYLKAFPDDNALRLRWAAARLQQAHSAEQRAGFLKSLTEARDLPAPFRAEAAAMLAKVRQRQGRTPDALAAARRALELDPCGLSGLAVWTALGGPSTAPEQVQAHLRRLCGDPRALTEAWAGALKIGELGLHEQALRLFEHAWPNAESAKLPLKNVPHQRLLVHYGNALLDAGRHDQAIAMLASAVQRFARNPDLPPLLLEAYRASGKKAEADELIQDMQKSYQDREVVGEIAASFSAELGWFHLQTVPRPQIAYIHAQRAVEIDPNNVVFQRVLGAAELDSGRAPEQKKGLERLKKLLGKDSYASALLAEYHAGAGDTAACKQAILAASLLSRSGPAPRRLAALAKKHQVAIAPPKDRQAVAKLLAAFDPNHLTMVHEPEEFLVVSLEPAQQTIACGEAVELTATVRNIGSVNVPVGSPGLFRPNLALKVTVTGDSGVEPVTVGSVPMAVWPAGRYLHPGEALSCKVRLDVADLARELAHRPLEDLTLAVTGTVDPLDGGGTALPSLESPKARITRAGVLGRFDRGKPQAWDYAYRAALGRIVGDLRRGTPARRMQAARQTASLLAFARDVETRRAMMPRQLARSLDKLVLLSMTRAFLGDASPGVRQEMIASLAHVSLDEIVISLLAPAIEDPSPMVRCRLVELLASKQTRGHKTIVDLLAKDTDDLVAAMAKAFRKREAP